jgi:hypothetical protein
LTVAVAAAIAGAVGAGGPGRNAAAAAPAAGSSFSHSATISRPYVHAGVAGVDTRTVTLDVSNTQALEGRQEIAVSWSGAHPTGGIVPDPNSTAGELEEYPMVLLECRGTAGASDPVTPESCWTQDWNSRYEDDFTDNSDGLWPAYRLDQYQTDPGAAFVGAPATNPATCSALEAATVQYWVPWSAESGAVYDGGLGGQCGEPPEATDAGASALPSNEVYGVTARDGAGSTNFDILNATENGTLGCSQTVACSLVAIPIMGISCDAALLGSDPTPAQLSALADCENTGYFAPGALQSSQGTPETELTVSGRLWWSPSNWDHRIVVPLTFAPIPGSCSIVGSGNEVLVYGSELMLQATTQWAPTFCSNNSSRFSFVHVLEGEPQARNQVATGSSQAAFTSYAQSLGYGRPVVNAPVGLTGFAISFAIDGENGVPIATLKLTPLLLAKLLTESYPGLTPGQGGDPALSGNPLDIAQDPEFQALNPGINPHLPNSVAASVLISLSSDSDVMEALTSYIEENAAARSFIDGVPDKSMAGEDVVVNPAYKRIKLPVDQWPLLSTYESQAFDNNATNAPCLASNPQPLNSLIASPLPTLEEIGLDMQFFKANSTTTCSSTGADGTVNSMVANGTESPGFRFLLGITPLADVYRYGLTPAELMTTDGTFVGPSEASMKAAASLLRPDASTGTWPIPYSEFDTPDGSSAYPGTMVVYAAVPTSGLPKTAAADLASVLRFAAGSGQTPGSGVGQIPGGYLPLTASDGLGSLASYTVAAAADVAAQNGEIPSLTPTPGGHDTTTTIKRSGGKPVTGTGGTPTPTPTTVTQTPTTTASSPSSQVTSPSPTAAAAPAPPPRPSPVHQSASSPQHGSARAAMPSLRAISATEVGLWLGGLPVALIIGLAVGGLIAVPALYLMGRKRRRW